MKIIIGLGNPGKKYEFTRHNMGFITVEHLADKYNIRLEKLKFRSLIGEGTIEGEKVILVKPQTYMNLSGEAVREIVSFYKIPIDDLILIYDDIDTETGYIRIRKFGSAGTHNGMKSVIFQLKTDKFPRVRIGIGKPGIVPLMNYVTGRISSNETKLLRTAVEDAGDAIISMMTEDIDMAMNKFNKRNTDE
jgi:PTH1 family peptidyl-tRNA hydrolase